MVVRSSELGSFGGVRLPAGAQPLTRRSRCSSASLAQPGVARATAALAPATQTSVPTVRLNSGHDFPRVGLGTFGLTGDRLTNAIHSALEMGYTGIDTAIMYQNEAAIGTALAEDLRSGKAKRHDLFVTSKLDNTFADHLEEGVEPAIRGSLERLKLDYLDLMLVHWPIVSDRPAPKAGQLEPSMQATWRGLEAAVGKGLVRSIGVSNFSPEKIEEWFQDARILPAVNQVEIHPYFRNDRVLRYCKEKNIHAAAYAPVSSPATMKSEGKDVPNLLKEEPTVRRIAEKNGKTTGQVMLAWHVARGNSCIPRSGNPKHQLENLEAASIQLPMEDLVALSSFAFQKRYFDGENVSWGPDMAWRSYEDLWNEPPVQYNPTFI